MTTYLITGSCGTIGSALVSQLANERTGCTVRCVDNSESLLYFQQRTYQGNPRVESYMGDIRMLFAEDKYKVMKTHVGLCIGPQVI